MSRRFTITPVPKSSPTPDLAAFLPAELDWHRDALCAQTDPEAYFPEARQDKRAGKGRAVCKGCPVREICLDWAIDNGERWGIWGGMTYRQRQREQGRRARADGQVAA